MKAAKLSPIRTIELAIVAFTPTVLIPTVLPASAASVKKPIRKPASSTLKKRRGYVVGRVTNMQGKALSGVEISIYGTTIAGANTHFAAITNAGGQFSQRVPEGIYGVAAYYKTRYNGKNYRFTLCPTDGITAARHDSAPGIVKEFRWKISGLKPGEVAGEPGTHTEGNKYYGGYILLNNAEKGTLQTPVYFQQGSRLVITLTPRAKLIDGSTGKSLVFKRTFAKDETGSMYWYLTNIPIGLYTLNSRLIGADGTEKTLKAKKSLDFSGAYTPSLNVDFEPTSFGDMQMMQVTIDPLAGP